MSPKTDKKPTTAFAIVNDTNRRGRVRVCRVHVGEIFHGLDAAIVEETRLPRLSHVLPFSRLAQRRADVPAKLREAISRTVRASEEPALTASPGAAQTARARLWYQRDLEEPVSA